MKLRLALILVILFCRSLLAAEASIGDGYVSDVSTERQTRFYEIFIFSSPPAGDRPLSELIFNESLSNEFKAKYHETFGNLDAESIVYQPTKFSIFDENRGAVLQLESKQERRKLFAEYMLKRLIEWHFDNFLRKDPTMKPVYELKEKLSNVQVEVNKETKINIRYNFSDNTADLICENPYVDSKLALMMDPKRFGPGPLLEQNLFIEKQLSKRLRLNSGATLVDGIARFEFVRSWKSLWSTSLGGTTPFHNKGGSPRENRYLIGLSRSY